ncbi:hypothetical protein AK830_g1177 [Neonectria ditissima]|uniref:Sulfatase N-terminal domain-containing protein n=1 Tax=Neonectria ditissima TaxID=78410 RepID=A0A0P7BJI6_9HYPO|nr:hypothetical protein AK830_g1177 [Neonectria ditissima]
MFATFVPFSFSVAFVSLTFTKLVHLSIHAKTVPPASFVLFLPSLLLSDVFVICLLRLALRQKKGVIAVAACTLGCLLSFILLGSASSQLGFFYSTGNEIKWSDALSYAGDKDGMKILLSGLHTVLAFGLSILVVAWFAKWYLYRATGALLVMVGAPISYGIHDCPPFGNALSQANRPQVWQSIRGSKAPRRRQYAQSQSTDSDSDSYDSDTDLDDEYDDSDDIEKNSAHSFGDGQNAKPVRATSWIIFAVILGFLALTTILRPSNPYDMMAATLPLAMLQMFQSTADVCIGQGSNPWPLPDLINESTWERPNGHFKGWAPGGNTDYAKRYRETVPEWLPETVPAGFSKWSNDSAVEDSDEEEVKDPHGCFDVGADGTFYNPVNDPMKITNLNDDILDVLRDTLGSGDVKIKHVALIMMESYREELFPLQQGSDIHTIIMKSHGKADVDEINERLSRMSPVAERITGKSGNFKRKDGSDFDPVLIPEWNDTTPDGFGGINVVGGFTTSSLSFKSMAAIHCGAWPMPVNSFEESETQAYQPCIPQIFDLFNNIKEENDSTEDFAEQQWLPAFFQSITDGYDRQAKFDKKIGFKHIVTKDRLDDDAGEDEELEEINYFGYPETTLKSHIEDYIKDAQEGNKRMFLSHFTSTTHHPWGTPRSFQKAHYLKTRGKMGWHEDFDNYLNAMRFTDAWLGELLQTFDNHGLSNETLFIFVGDHGQAFKEDDRHKTGTYENGHVSNFRVPITFRHPNIPRVQYNANATSLSILPTILDLLINTGSLNAKDTEVASDLIHDYEGQSLIRPYKASQNGRRAWNFGVINGGGSMLSLTSADAPWRIVIPLDRNSQFRFTDLKNDPLELEPLERWSLGQLIDAVKAKFGEDAAQWTAEAGPAAKWWGTERKRLWGYNPKDSHDE